MLEKGPVPRAGTHRELLLAYVGGLREKAAGRSGGGQKSLTEARIRESTANAISKELANVEAAKRLIDVTEIGLALRA